MKHVLASYFRVEWIKLLIAIEDIAIGAKVEIANINLYEDDDIDKLC